MAASDPTERFTSRVDNYVRYRPGYPTEVIDLLHSECGLTGESRVADIASGTGIFTRLLLESGSCVFGVEPNAEMRRAGEQWLAGYARFTSVAGSAEATTLPERSVDIVAAAQAAHWFDREKARREFQRILEPGGWMVLLWNERRNGSTPFLEAYEQLLQTFGTDYGAVRHEHTTVAIDAFFSPLPFEAHTFAMRQEVDYLALEGRLLSSSYTPQPGDPRYRPMLSELRRIFDACQSQGRVALEYDTRVFYGRLG
jgi:SAM-dependent methyltransferase